MKLFGAEDLNLLPFDGDAILTEGMMEESLSYQVFNSLFKNIDWKPDELIMYGKKIVTKREMAWYGDKPFDYHYSNRSKIALPWTKELVDIKKIVEESSGYTYNSCLLNLYHTGEEGLSWHSDDEPELGDQPVIASLSLGVTRKFSLKHKETKETVNVNLYSGSLLVMKGLCQEKWLHSLAKTKKVTEPRINLTFRTIKDGL